MRIEDMIEKIYDSNFSNFKEEKVKHKLNSNDIKEMSFENKQKRKKKSRRGPSP